MPPKKLLLLLLIFVLCLGNLSCKRQPKSTAEVPIVLSHGYTISVAPFTQPTTPQELILGRIPEQQGVINANDLQMLDQEFKHILYSKKNRRYVFLESRLPLTSLNTHSAAQPQGLNYWVEYGRKHGADLLLVPQVLNWHEREGSRAGVTQSAWVRVEFFLLRIRTGQIMHRSIFEEKQEALTDNFLNIGSFLKRRGTWVTATDLAKDGMQKACKDLGI
ncbi:MAG: hypothetical protein IJU79_03380 [Desulfovibrionaceae bacterium]|nr:hypothetical protein [Desulfovibrionaceae bacterium]